MKETYKLPEGKITIDSCNSERSIGSLALNPGKELEKHNRPFDEELIQIKGVSIIKLFKEDNTVEEITLKEGDKLIISKNQFHIHSNSSNENSITQWKFEGDIVEIIKNIRVKYVRIKEE